MNMRVTSRWLLLGMLVLGLSACLTTGRRGSESALAVYDFGPPASAQARPAGLPLLSLEVRAPYWFDSLGIEYRLAYAEPARLRDYAQARWAGPPATLVQQRLTQTLGFVPQGQGGAKCLLRVEMDEFSQVFDQPQQSRGVLDSRVSVLGPARKVLAERSFHHEAAAPSADSRGGVAAMTQVVNTLQAEVAAWHEQLWRNGQIKVCDK